MTDEQLQFAISQYIDGLLPADQVAQLEQRLASDPAARQTLAEYRRLNALINSSLAMPDVDWDAFAEEVSENVGQGAPIPMRPETWTWRSLALAAGLLLTATVAVIVYSTRQAPEPLVSNIPQPPPGQKGILQVALVAPPAPVGPAVAEIDIGPSPTVHLIETLALYPRDVTAQRPSSVTIAGLPGRDEDSLLLQ